MSADHHRVRPLGVRGNASARLQPASRVAFPEGPFSLREIIDG